MMHGSMPPMQVVEFGGQKGCVVLDLCENKREQLKCLPGLLRAAEEGYYAAVGACAWLVTQYY